MLLFQGIRSTGEISRPRQDVVGFLGSVEVSCCWLLVEMSIGKRRDGMLARVFRSLTVTAEVVVWVAGSQGRRKGNDALDDVATRTRDARWNCFGLMAQSTTRAIRQGDSEKREKKEKIKRKIALLCYSMECLAEGRPDCCLLSV